MTFKEKLEHLPVSNDLFEGISKSELKTDDILAQVAIRILTERQKRNMTQKEFAEFMGVSQPLVSKWEGAEQNFVISNLVEIFDKLDIEVDVAFDKVIRNNIKERKEEVYCFAFATNYWDVTTSNKTRVSGNDILKLGAGA